MFVNNLEAVASTVLPDVPAGWQRGHSLDRLGLQMRSQPSHFQTTDTPVILVSVQTQPSEAFSPVCWSLFFVESQSSPPSLLHPGSGLCGEVFFFSKNAQKGTFFHL